MKKCPKCGTILDDSKTKCYMCGASLGVGGPVSFLDSIDNDIGATVASSQDNVFNNGEDIEVLNLEDVTNKSEPQTFVSHSSSTRDFYTSEINQLNLGNVDDYNPFATDNAPAKPAPQGQINNTINEVKNLEPVQLPPQNQNQQPQPQPVKEKPKKEPKQKDVNWGNSLSTSNGEILIGSFKVTKPMIFNGVCFFIFMGLIIFAYVKFIKKPSNENVYLGGLVYTIDPRFQLMNNGSATSREYRYTSSEGECDVTIEYGLNPSDDEKGSISKYLDQTREAYEKNPNAQFKEDTIIINGEMWTTLDINFVVGDNLSQGEGQVVTKFKVTTIIHKGNMYYIRYSNPNVEKTCETMFNNLMGTLAFV